MDSSDRSRRWDKLKISTDGVTYTDKVTVDKPTTTEATGLTAGVLSYVKVVAYKGTHDSTGTNVYDTRFKITVDTTKAGSANDTFVLPTIGAGLIVYDYYVDWGDGGAEQHVIVNTSQTHVYSASGTYQVKIRGTFPSIYFFNTGDKLKLMSIDNWGQVVFGGAMTNAFYGCSNMVGNYIDVPDMSRVTEVFHFFMNCSSFNTPVVFNTGICTLFTDMFYGCSTFNSSVNISTVAGTDMKNMFYNCTAFNKPLTSLNTSNVTVMRGMFYGCAGL